MLTHMPFLTYDLQGQRILFFTESDDCEPHCWKIHYTMNDGESLRLETGFAHGMIECSPTAWQDESGWHVSFIAMSVTTEAEYLLCVLRQKITPDQIFPTLKAPPFILLSWLFLFVR